MSVEEVHNPERGRYIVIEGPEAVGKSTQIAKVIGKLATLGIEASSDLREPGGTPIGEGIRNLLLDPNLERDPLTNLYLFYAGRNETLKRIHEEKQNGKWAVVDRNWLASAAYQVGGERVDQKHLASLHEPVRAIAQTDLTLILFVSEAEQLRRMQERGTTDHFENQSPEYFRRVYLSYLVNSNTGAIPVDGEGAEEDVFDRVWQFVEPMVQGEDHFTFANYAKGRTINRYYLWEEAEGILSKYWSLYNQNYSKLETGVENE